MKMIGSCRLSARSRFLVSSSVAIVALLRRIERAVLPARVSFHHRSRQAEIGNAGGNAAASCTRFRFVQALLTCQGTPPAPPPRPCRPRALGQVGRACRPGRGARARGPAERRSGGPGEVFLCLRRRGGAARGLRRTRDQRIPCAPALGDRARTRQRIRPRDRRVAHRLCEDAWRRAALSPDHDRARLLRASGLHAHRAQPRSAGDRRDRGVPLAVPFERAVPYTGRIEATGPTAMTRETEIAGVILRDDTVPPGRPWSGVIRRGERLRIVDPEGNQGGGFLCYNAADTAERYHAPNTLKAAKTLKLTTGHRLYSDLARPLFAIVADTCHGWHDTIGGSFTAPPDQEL